MSNDYDIENFQSIWNRVRSEESAEEESTDEIGILRKFIDGEAADIAEYGSLIGKCHGPVSKLLCAILVDEKNHMKKLQTMHFILTGDTYAPEKSQKGYTSFLEALRGQYNGEVEGSAQYKKAWNSTKNDRLRELYADFSSDEFKLRRILAESIAGLMC